mmetsp:Transcript_30893/g.88871  ORF Transcript_30893/g.88871 Transcript_30893/m.88871 type:complete len:1295 (+) Transcript_30893:66-3950(+)
MRADGTDDVPVYPLVYDIPDWQALDWIAACRQTVTALEEKGFCFINGFAGDKVRRLAEQEARALKRAGSMRRTPEEATHSLLGPLNSCWTLELAPADEEAVEAEENLRRLEKCLDEVGNSVAQGCGSVFGEVCGRGVALLHYSKMPEDRAAPKLIDPEEAVDYCARASRKRVGLYYCLGPSSTVISITPREDPTRPYCVMTRSPIIVAYRSDACVVDMGSKGVNITLEAEFFLRAGAGRNTAMNILPIPEVLANWFTDRLEAIAESDANEGVPLSYQREAAMLFHKSVPVRVMELWHELPTLPLAGGGVVPFEASLLGGLDPVTEICKPRPPEVEGGTGFFHSMCSWGGKWDPDEYYDPDPLTASEFKMYTRHLSVLNRNGPQEFDAREFGILRLEDLSMDHRARMLLEGTTQCLADADLDIKKQISGKEVGLFFGLSGGNQFWSFMNRESKINQHAAANLSSSTLVGRLSYHFGSQGPSVCIDTEDSSGMVALDTAVTALRQDKCGPYALVGSCHWIANPFETILQCATGVISKSGRTRIWEESGDGFVKGEGVVVMVLDLLKSSSNSNTKSAFAVMTQPGRKEDDDLGCRALITGSAVNSKGASSSLAAPNAMALLEVIHKAEKDAHKPFMAIDAVEASAGGGQIADCIELGTLQKLLIAPERVAQSIPIRPSKSTYGNLGPVSGLVGLARSCALLEMGTHGPMLHLHQMLDMAGMVQDGVEESERRMLMLTEAIEAKSVTQLVGLSSFGSTGTNCHNILWGKLALPQAEPRLSRPLSWWPAAVQAEVQPPLKGYYIVGTWTAWKQPRLMQETSEGVFEYTLMMGENNWERFQIWLDEDAERCLHPAASSVAGVGGRRRESDRGVEGPGPAEKDSSWYVTANSQMVRLVNEVQLERLRAAREAALDAGEDPIEQDPLCVVAFVGDHKPAGHEDAQDETGMPTADLNAQFLGQPGDRYRIRLHVRGKYKRVEWAKLPETIDTSAMEVEPAFAHRYHIIGDHNYWTFDEMEPATGEEGLHIATVQLLSDKSHFQVYRDGDWDQGFHPSIAGGSSSSEIRGPDALGHGINWQISGAVGDLFKVEFRRRRVGGADERSVRWGFDRAGSVDFEEQAKSHKYFCISSSTNFEAPSEMRRDEANGHFSLELPVGRSGVEYFQLLHNGNYMAALHPDIKDASMHDDGHKLEGPDDGGADKFWAIGQNPKDELKPGDHVIIHLHLQGGRPMRVWWERHDSPEAHNHYLAWGCERIFERHCRLLGFVPYQSKEQPAQRLGRADFQAAERGILGKTTPLSLME